MPRRRLAAAAVIAAVLAAGLAQAACQPPPGGAEMQKVLLKEVNAERRAAGLAPLRLDGKLEKAAQAHACDNARRHSISHESSDGSALQHRLKRVGYAFGVAAENTGRGFGSPERAVDWWMNSSGHRANILMKGISEIGIGIAESAAPDSRLHWVLVFAKPR